MESLYRKYRPQTFSDVVGQAPVVSTLEHGIESGSLGHAYLFCGPRGTGKTTLARILAKAVVCERGAGQLPDGTCEQCVAVAEGRHPDVHELDAASRTGVDAVREEIVNRVDFAPTLGRQKVYIVDEVHMLTTQAFNALLKTLEEPPAHVVFVLCTTDPQKIPATILSRVQRFDFRAIGEDDIRARLDHVCAEEGFAADPAAIELVARHARGGMRDALSTLEQLSVFGSGRIELADARALFGTTDADTLSRAMGALADRDARTLFSVVAEQVDAGSDLQRFCEALVGRLRDLYVAAVAGDVESLLGGTAEERAALVAESASFPGPDRIVRLLDGLGQTALAMRDAQNPRLQLEVALARLARPDGDLTVEALAERVDALERALAAGGAPADAAAPAATATKAPVPAATAPKAPAPAAAPAPPRPADPAPTTRPAGTPAPVPVPAKKAPAQKSPAPAPAAPAQAGSPALDEAWSRVLEALRAASPSTHALFMTARLVADDGRELTVASPRASFVSGLLARPDVSQALDGAVGRVLGPRTWRLVPDGGAAARPPAPAAPAPPAAPKPAAPAPTPAPSPAPAPTPVPTPAPGAAPARPQTPRGPLPWEEAPATPAATPAPVPPPFEDGPSYDDYVPYEALGDVPAPPRPPAAPAPVPAPDDPFARAAAEAAGAPVPMDPSSLSAGQSATVDLVASVFGEGVRPLPVEGGNPFEGAR